ncbi:MAG: hypothetical protein ACQUHE_00515 [Bacteroidia bacterium]
MRIFIFCLLSCLCGQNVAAQVLLEEKMKWYSQARPTSNLFVHFDKNVYSNNETVYFTGYVVKTGRVPMTAHTVMAIALIREVDSALIMEDKFLMSMGLSFGSLTLPDSIPTGNYRFIVYTDKLVEKLPELLFSQQITIKSSIEPTFKADVKLMTQGNTSNKSHQVLVSTATIDGRFLANPTKISYTYGSAKKTLQTDASGQAMINLPPQIDLADPNLYVKVKHGNDSSFLNINLPAPKSKASVRFYPEGGHMVNGLVSNVAWEVKDRQNRPIALKAFLYKNQDVIDTIETGSLGIGNFKLKPIHGAEYSIKLIHSNLLDSIYRLPRVFDDGVTLMAQNALTKDTLIIQFRSASLSKFNLIIHNFKNTFLAVPLELKEKNMLLKLPLDEVPKGLNTLTILDTLNRPLAERIFFAHYSKEEKVAIQTDKTTYNQREKISLKLKLKIDEAALVSIAVVQNNRLDFKKTNDIENYTYITNELHSPPMSSAGLPFHDQEYLSHILSVKGWSRYTWQDLIDSKAADTIATIDSLKITGQVLALKKALAPPFTIGTMGTKEVSLIPTSLKGSFTFENEQLITPPGKKMYVFVNGGEKLVSGTKVKIPDQFSNLNISLAKNFPNAQPILPSTLVNNTELLIKSNEKAIRLKEVVITKVKDEHFKQTGANACGDYVCPFNILNCRNHVGYPKNTMPIKGGTYIISSGFSATTIYGGCNVPDKNLFTLVKGIHVHKEFYLDEYRDPLEPAYFSTIYWNYGEMLNSKKETELSFYSSDISGKFKIVVQGVTTKDVVYVEHFFDVK